MPYTNESPSQSDIQYFLSRYDGFKKESGELIAKYSQPGFHYQWILEHSNFSDPEDYNRLILICSSDECGEEKRINCFEKGY